MSPKSRKRKVSSSRSTSRSNKAPANPLWELYRNLEPAYAADLDQTSSLKSEQLASELYANMHQTSNLGPGIDAQMVTDWVKCLEKQKSREALAMLHALASVADTPADAEAAAAAQRLEDADVEPPAWLAPLRSLTATAAWEMTDSFEDYRQLILEFRTGRRKHGMGMTIDTNHMGGYATDIGMADSAKTILDACERMIKEFPATGMALEPVDLPHAQHLGLDAIAATDITNDPETGEGYEGARSLALKRLLAIGGNPVVSLADHRELSEAEELEADRKLDATFDRLTKEFMVEMSEHPDAVADEARNYPEEFERLARLALDFGHNYDDGRLTRISPVKITNFVAGFLARKVMLSETEEEALPLFLDEWILWCADRHDLSEETIPIMLQALDSALAEVAQLRESGEEERFPGMAFLEGVEAESMEDVQETFARRQFAMPYFGTRIGSADYPQLNANVRQEMRLLVLGELERLHGVDTDQYPVTDEPDGSPVWDAALREIVVNQLWHDSPSQVWEAVQRLESGGLERDAVLTALQDALSGHVEAGKLPEMHDAGDFNSAVDLTGYVATLNTLGARGKGGHLRSV